MTSILNDSPYRVEPWNAADAYRSIEEAALLPDVKRLAQAHRASLRPVDRAWLKKRLSAMMLAFGHERDPDRVAAWLTETGRLLVDLPGDILATAIDEAIKRSARGFIPAVGEIRAIADPLVEQREREAHRLEALAGMVDAGGPRRPRPWEQVDTFDPATRCSPEDAQAVLEEFGMRSAPKPEQRRGPAQAPTAASIGAIAKELGIGQGRSHPLAGMPAPDIRGLSITQIAEQGDRLCAEWLAGTHPAHPDQQRKNLPPSEIERRDREAMERDMDDLERRYG